MISCSSLATVISHSVQTETWPVSYDNSYSGVQRGNCQIQKRQIQYLGL